MLFVSSRFEQEIKRFQAARRYSCCYIDDIKTGMRGVVLAGGYVLHGVNSSNNRGVNTALLYDLNSKVRIDVVE